MTTPPITSRAQKSINRKMQPGTILSFTTIHHPPAGFGNAPRVIALIELEDGTRTLAPISTFDIRHSTLQIGMHVTPIMRLQRINEQGLRIYDVSYKPLNQNPKTIQPKTFPGYIIALTGPSGVGKSTICAKLAIMASDFTAKVPIVTTREPKDGDEDEYRYISQKEFAELKQKGEIISATNIPSSTEKRWYGYCKGDIEKIWNEGRIPIVITEMHLLQGLASHFGRRSILSFGLLPPGKSKRAMLSQLLHRLRSRGRDTEQSIADRIMNAKEDLLFFEKRKELFDHFVINKDLQKALETIQVHVAEIAEG